MSNTTKSCNSPRWFRRPRWITLLLIFSLYAIPRLWTTARFSGQAHVPSLDGEFPRISSLLPSADGRLISFHRGLPHNYFDSLDFLHAVWLSPTWSYHGYCFEFSEWSPSPEFRTLVHSAFTQKHSFKQYGGPKLCGGYHADFLAEFTTSTGTTQFMVCLGCHEVLVFAPSGSGIVELSRDAYDALLKAWKHETD
jgi:hypothetical protein